MITITSPSFVNNGHIPDKFTCNGENIHPRLDFYGIPEKTVSMVLTVVDPDSPSGHFTHWIVINIDPATREISEHATFYGAHAGRNDFGDSHYGGPCPGYGTHRYVFTLYALDKKLDLSSDANRSQVEESMKGHIIDQGHLIGLYTKK